MHFADKDHVLFAEALHHLSVIGLAAVRIEYRIGFLLLRRNRRGGKAARK